jgi:biotin carboxylase
MWAVPAGLTWPEAKDVADRVNYPAVLKTEHGSGSVDMHLLQSSDELLAC